MLCLNTIKKMLRIIDKNLTILAVLEQKIKGRQTLVIKAKLVPCFSHCNCTKDPLLKNKQ